MSGKSTMKNFTAMLAKAQLPETTVPICLAGHLAAEHEAAERELEEASRKPGDSLAGTGAAAIVERIEALEVEMRENTYDFRLRAMPRAAWTTLVNAHPPRRGDDNEIVDTDRMGVNAETFYAAIIRACLVDPELTDDEWSQLEQKLTDRQYSDLADAAWALNRREVDIPFSLAASRMRRDSGAE